MGYFIVPKRRVKPKLILNELGSDTVSLRIVIGVVSLSRTLGAAYSSIDDFPVSIL